MGDPHLMEILDLSNVATAGCVCHWVGGDPLDVNFAGFRIDLNVAWNRIAEGLDLCYRVIGEHVGLQEHIAAVVRGGDPDLAGREVVIGNIDLILSRGGFTWVHGQPGAVDKRCATSRDTLE